MAPQQPTIQEQITQLSEEMAQIREEIGILKGRLARKKETMKILKKRASPSLQSSGAGFVTKREDTSQFPLEYNVKRLILFDQLCSTTQEDSTVFQCSLASPPPYPQEDLLLSYPPGTGLAGLQKNPPSSRLASSVMSIPFYDQKRVGTASPHVGRSGKSNLRLKQKKMSVIHSEKKPKEHCSNSNSNNLTVSARDRLSCLTAISPRFIIDNGSGSGSSMSALSLPLAARGKEVGKKRRPRSSSVLVTLPSASLDQESGDLFNAKRKKKGLTNPEPSSTPSSPSCSTTSPPLSPSEPQSPTISATPPGLRTASESSWRYPEAAPGNPQGFSPNSDQEGERISPILSPYSSCSSRSSARNLPLYSTPPLETYSKKRRTSIAKRKVAKMSPASQRKNRSPPPSSAEVSSWKGLVPQKKGGLTITCSTSLSLTPPSSPSPTGNLASTQHRKSDRLPLHPGTLVLNNNNSPPFSLNDSSTPTAASHHSRSPSCVPPLSPSLSPSRSQSQSQSHSPLHSISCSNRPGSPHLSLRYPSLQSPRNHKILQSPPPSPPSSPSPFAPTSSPSPSVLASSTPLGKSSPLASCSTSLSSELRSSSPAFLAHSSFDITSYSQHNFNPSSYGYDSDHSSCSQQNFEALPYSHHNEPNSDSVSYFNPDTASDSQPHPNKDTLSSPQRGSDAVSYSQYDPDIAVDSQCDSDGISYSQFDPDTVVADSQHDTDTLPSSTPFSQNPDDAISYSQLSSDPASPSLYGNPDVPVSYSIHNHFSYSQGSVSPSPYHHPDVVPYSLHNNPADSVSSSQYNLDDSVAYFQHTPNDSVSYSQHPPADSVFYSQHAPTDSVAYSQHTPADSVPYSQHDPPSQCVSPVLLSPVSPATKPTHFTFSYQKKTVDETKENEKKNVRQIALSQWTYRFQTCLERLRNLNDLSAQKRRVEANTALMHLSEDFVAASRAVGKIIISEVFLPHDDKVIKPLTGLGGCAGGKKYIVHNILFKFALDDSSGLFGGSDLAAAKVSGHELKGLMAYFGVGLQDVNFPLMTLVDYRGFRLAAISILPVTKDTLIYGTCDAGRNYHNSNSEFSQRMDEAAVALNLRPHLCGPSKFKLVRLASAADIEGHRGLDGKFYLLDFSRTMPPVSPTPKKFFNGHLYQLFRREFVGAYGKRLCSDAFSGFIAHDRNAKMHNQEVIAATEVLFNEVIPQCAASLLEEFRQAQAESSQGDLSTFPKVSEIMHRAGVNVRYIGNVVQAVDELVGRKSKDPALVSAVIGALLAEAVARVVKNELNLLMREKAKELKLPLEVPYRQVVVDYLNNVFGRGSAHDQWWKERLPPLLERYFNVVLGLRKRELRAMILTRKYLGSRVFFFNRIVELTGLVFSFRIFKKFEAQSVWMSEPFDYLDLIEIGDRVKCMDIVSLSQGNFFLYQALLQNDLRTEGSLLLRAIAKYEEALNSNVNVETLMNCSIAYYNYLITQLTEKGDESFDPADMRVQKAEKCMLQLVKIHNNTKSLCLYAMYLVRCQQYVLAEEYFLNSIKDDPINSFALIQYYYFLSLCGLHSAAEHSLRVIEEQTKTKVISPYCGKELGGVVKVFVGNGTFKSLSVTATTTAMDIVAQVAHTLKREHDPLQLQLAVIDPGLSVKKMAGDLWKNEVDWANVWDTAKKKEVLRASSLPFIFLQRPNNTSFLYLQNVVSPLSPIPLYKVLNSQKTLPQESQAFLKDDINFVTYLLNYDHSDGLLEALFFAAPLIISLDSLRQCLEVSLESSKVASLLDLWVITSEDFDLQELESIFLLAFSSPNAEMFQLLEEKRHLVRRVTHAEEEMAEFLELSKKLPQLVPAEGKVMFISDPLFDLGTHLTTHRVFPETKSTFIFQTCFHVRDKDSDEIKELAEHLRVWAAMVQFQITPRHFLLYSSRQLERNIPTSIMAALLYESKISEWVLNEILSANETPEEPLQDLQNQLKCLVCSPSLPPSASSLSSSLSSSSSPSASPVLSPPNTPPPSPCTCTCTASSSSADPCLRTFEKFVDLAIESCNIGDLSTAIAIVDALMSPDIQSVHAGWGKLPEHRAVRWKFERSVPYIHFGVTGSTPPEEILSKYSNALEVLQKTSHVYLSSIRRTMTFLRSFAVLVPMDPETKKPVLDVGTVSAAYPIVKRATQGIQRGSGKIGRLFRHWNGLESPLARSLVGGPLRGVHSYLADSARIQAFQTFSSVPLVMVGEETSALPAAGQLLLDGATQPKKIQETLRKKNDGVRKKGGNR